jgi:putative transposase
VRGDIGKEPVALADGYRGPAESWTDPLCECRRGMIAPLLGVGDGALGFSKSVQVVLPATGEQGCWLQAQTNVSAALPHSAVRSRRWATPTTPRTSTRPSSRSSPSRSTMVPNALKRFAENVADADVLLKFYQYPAEHWVHLRTTNPTESTVVTVRFRTKVPRDPDPARTELSWPTGSPTPHKAAGEHQRAPPVRRRPRRRRLPRRQTARTAGRHHCRRTTTR